MRLVKGDRTFTTDDPSVIAGFKTAGFVEQAEPAAEEPPKKPAKRTRSK